MNSQSTAATRPTLPLRLMVKQLLLSQKPKSAPVSSSFHGHPATLPAVPAPAGATTQHGYRHGGLNE